NVAIGQTRSFFADFFTALKKSDSPTSLLPSLGSRFDVLARGGDLLFRRAEEHGDGKRGDGSKGDPPRKFQLRQPVRFPQNRVLIFFDQLPNFIVQPAEDDHEYEADDHREDVSALAAARAREHPAK